MAIRPKMGDVFEIPLPDGKVAYCRLYKDVCVGVFNLISANSELLATVRGNEIAFFSHVFTHAMKDGSWKKIGNIPFSSEDEAWPPPQYRQDIINKTSFTICHKGECWPATEKQVQGMERELMRKPGQLIDEIVSRLQHSHAGTHL